jgi:hypothetical protein
MYVDIQHCRTLRENETFELRRNLMLAVIAVITWLVVEFKKEKESRYTKIRT